MSEDKANRGPRVSDLVNVHEGTEVLYWTKKWGVTEAQLRNAVGRVGVMEADVAKALGK